MKAVLISIYRWLRKWPLAVRISISAATLLAAISALVDLHTFFNGFFSSPEKQLTELGYPTRNYEEFKRAIINQHIEAVDLFVKIRKRVKPRDFALLFDDEVYNRDVIEALIDGDGLTYEHCPTARPSISVYLTSAPDKRKILRQLCGNSEVVKAISSELAVETKKIEELERTNEARDSTIEICRAKHESENFESIISDAARFSILSRGTRSERECILAKLNVMLLMGRQDLRKQFPRIIQQTASECCDLYHPVRSVDREYRRELAHVIRLLE